jgi:hypothetical protein
MIRPVGVAEIDRRRLVIKRIMIKIVNRPAAATIGKPSDTTGAEYADLAGDGRPQRGLRRTPAKPLPPPEP